MKSMKIPHPPAPPEEDTSKDSSSASELDEQSLTGEQIMADSARASFQTDTGRTDTDTRYVYPIDPAQPGDEDPDWDTFRFPTPPPAWARQKSGARGSPLPAGKESADTDAPPAPPRMPLSDSSAPLADPAVPLSDHLGGLPPSVLVGTLGLDPHAVPSRPASTSAGHKVLPTVPPGPLAPARDASEDRAPRWAAPVQMVNSWHLDLGRMVLVHPGRRQKIDLSRVVSRARLVALCGLMKREPTAVDFQRLWLGLDQACQLAFGMSLPETMASSMDTLVWPGDDWE